MQRRERRQRLQARGSDARAAATTQDLQVAERCKAAPVEPFALVAVERRQRCECIERVTVDVGFDALQRCQRCECRKRIPAQKLAVAADESAQVG